MFHHTSTPAESGVNWPSVLKLGSGYADNFPVISFGPAVNNHYETSLGNNWQGFYVASNFILNDQLFWTRGRHAFTFGGEFRAMEINSHSGSNALSFSFSPNATGSPAAAYGNQVGFGFASFLLGDVNNASATVPFDLYGRRKIMNLFAQDSYKVTPRLTPNLALRWNANFRFTKSMATGRISTCRR